jgi:DNA-binding transcriptional ArsR family regulator
MPTDTLSRTFAALADPTRRAMLARLAEGEATVNELAAPFDMSLPNISKHLKVLQGAGLVVQGREGQFRPCRLDPEAFEDASDWLDRHRQAYEERMDRLADYLRELQDGETGTDATTRPRRVARSTTAPRRRTDGRSGDTRP